MAEAESSKTALEEKIAHLETEIVMKRELVASMEAHPESDPDVVVVDDDAQPLVLCECKAPEIPIDRHVLAQAVRYNSVLGARYLVLTNGCWMVSVVVLLLYAVSAAWRCWQRL